MIRSLNNDTWQGIWESNPSKIKAGIYNYADWVTLSVLDFSFFLSNSNYYSIRTSSPSSSFNVNWRCPSSEKQQSVVYMNALIWYVGVI